MEQKNASRDFIVGKTVVECTAYQLANDSFEWKFVPRSMYEYNDEPRRGISHRLKDAHNLGKAMSKALHWMNNTDPEAFAMKCYQLAK